MSEENQRQIQENFCAWFCSSARYRVPTVKLLISVKNKKGKYGRILGEIICDGVNINQVMLETHLAVAYFGQSKEDIAEQHLQNRELIDHQNLFGHNE